MAITEKFIIRGGKPLRGTIEVMGAKNAALPILAATLFTEKECVIDNLPLIEDVFKMIEILGSLGADITWLSKRKIKVKCADIELKKLPCEAIGRFRGSVLILGPLLARFGKIKIPAPGGCLIGARSLDTHLDAFSQMGIKSSKNGGVYLFEKENKPKFAFKTYDSFIKKGGTQVVLREFSVTATENVLLFSALCSEKTSLKIADQDYQVWELARVLEKMGVLVNLKGGHAINICGKKKLNGFEHKIIADPIETGTFIVAALATKGRVVIKNAEFSFLDLFLKRLYDFGAKIKITKKNELEILPSGQLKMDKIQSLPYPGLHSDLQPELGVLATQTKGQTLIHDPLYEGRLRYLDGLNKMGADVIFCDPHRAVITGPTPLRGMELPSLDLRAGAAFIIAGLIAKGKTVIDNVYQIDRGYEKIEERLQKLGADIKRV